MIDTERLILRGWRHGDIEPFHAMGNDPEVMRFLGAPMRRRRSRARAPVLQAPAIASGR